LSLILLLVGSSLAWHYRGPIVERAQLLIAQRRCLTYSAPPNQVVYEANPNLGDALAAADPEYRKEPADVSTFFGVSGVLMVGTFRRMEPWERFNGALPRTASGPNWRPPNFQSVPIFLHERQAPPSQSRLVVIEMNFASKEITAKVIRPAAVWRRPEILWSGAPCPELVDVFKTYMLFNDPKNLGAQIFAGRIDPKDQSRFTIHMRVAGVAIQLYGQLLPDDRVRIDLPDAESLRQQVIKKFMTDD
jgi:hypothetical protein